MTSLPIKGLAAAMLLLIPAFIFCQTDQDAIMMNKNQFCNGLLYNYSSWDHYWEGKMKRTNENLGTVSTQSVMYMANYGITDNLNIMAAAPYVWTEATAGTLHKMHGIQDLSINAKWRFYNHKVGHNKVAVYAIGGFSTPLSNYTPDFLPLSIGLASTNLTTRAMVDYQYKRFTITGHAAYTWRSNIKIDRDAYYTDQLHLTNEVEMPNVTNLQLRAGYRGKYLIAEGIFNRMITEGGFDITRNNMPFPSNRMNASTVSAFIKWSLPFYPNLQLVGNAGYSFSGRNVGQSTMYGGGLFYAFYLNKNSKPIAVK